MLWHCGRIVPHSERGQSTHRTPTGPTPRTAMVLTLPALVRLHALPPAWCQRQCRVRRQRGSHIGRGGGERLSLREHGGGRHDAHHDRRFAAGRQGAEAGTTTFSAPIAAIDMTATTAASPYVAAPRPTPSWRWRCPSAMKLAPRRGRAHRRAWADGGKPWKPGGACCTVWRQSERRRYRDAGWRAGWAPAFTARLLALCDATGIAPAHGSRSPAGSQHRLSFHSSVQLQKVPSAFMCGHGPRGTIGPSV